MTELRTGFLSGPTEYRGMFGEGQQRRTLIGRLVALAILVVTLPISVWPGLAFSLPLAAIVALVTNESVTGDLLGKLTQKWVWAMRRWRGTDRFIPYSDDALEQAQATPRRRARQRAISAVRQMPDGAVGLGWLENRPGKVGIAWHRPTDKCEYLSVAWEVDGRMRGFESRDSLNHSSQLYGEFLASLGGDFSLCRQVQTLTRILPPNAVHHAVWARDNMDWELAARGQAGARVLRSHEQVLDTAIAIGTAQRHFIVLRFDVDDDFRAHARRYGKGEQAWRTLMEHEIEALSRRLNVSGQGSARPLTARQVAAFIRHAQNPTFELDRVDNIDPNNFGVMSFDKRSAYITHDQPMSEVAGVPVRYYSATARITADVLDAQLRNMFWVNDWLTNMPEPIVRSMSFHMRIVPARVARAKAMADLTMDAAELEAKRRAGSLATNDSEAKQLAAAIRADELRPGTGHHGLEWMMCLTVTATSEEELARHTRILAEVASTSLGIRRLTWCRNTQSVAAGYTWPIARGLEAHKTGGWGNKVEGAIARVDQDKDSRV